MRNKKKANKKYKRKKWHRFGFIIESIAAITTTKIYEDVGSREDTSKLNYFFHVDYETLSLCILQNVSVVLIKN